MIKKRYGVTDVWPDDKITNVVEFESTDGAITGAWINGVPAGGGGGDFNTAKVTFTELSGRAVYMPFAVSYGGISAALSVVNEIGEYDAIKYKGTCIAEHIGAGYTIEVVSGSAEKDGNMIIITGPCSLRVVPD